MLSPLLRVNGVNHWINEVGVAVDWAPLPTRSHIEDVAHALKRKAHYFDSASHTSVLLGSFWGELGADSQNCSPPTNTPEDATSNTEDLARLFFHIRPLF